MPRAKQSKEVKVVGPTLYVGSKKVVEFDTNFIADGANGLDWSELSQKALELHNNFVNIVNDKLATIARPADSVEE